MKINLRQGVTLILFMLTLITTSVASAARQPLDRVVAIVDDGVILQTELDARLRTIASRLSAQGTGLPPQSVLEERVLEQLITDSIQLQTAENMGVRISDNELNDTMESIVSRNNMTLDQFEEQLLKEGLSYREAREQIRQEMLISRVQQRRVGNRIRVTEREVENYLQAQDSQGADGAEYELAHILIEVNNFNDQEQVGQARAKVGRLLEEIRGGRDFRAVAVAESDASNALEGGVLGWRPEGQLPSLLAEEVPGLAVGETSDVLESGSGFHLVTVLDKRGKGAQVIEQSRARHILIRTTPTVSDAQAEARAYKIYQSLQDGADFAEVARESSDDAISGSDGGNLDWISRGQMVPEFEQEMLSADIGELTGPFRSQFGWHILEVQERRQKDIGNDVREAEAKQAIYSRKFEVELQNWMREIRDEAFVEVKTQEAADV